MWRILWSLINKLTSESIYVFVVNSFIFCCDVPLEQTSSFLYFSFPFFLWYNEFFSRNFKPVTTECSIDHAPVFKEYWITE